MERGPRRDSGNTYVLESIIVALLLVASAYTVTTLRRSSQDNVQPRSELERISTDALVVLAGLNDTRGTALESAVVDALHCARDATPSTTDCQGARPSNLTLRLGNYLPVGAGYALQIDNGVARQTVYGTGLPQGEATSSSTTFAPAWNMTFVLPELSCYPSTTDANVTMLPLTRARTGSLTALNVSYGGATEAIAVHGIGSWWNATIPAASRATPAILTANATGKGAPFNGSAGIGLCDLNGKDGAIVTALRAATFAPDSSTIAIGSNTTLRANVTALGAISGATRGTAEMIVYEPVTPRAANDTWVIANRTALPTGNYANASWAPPSASFYGTHVVVLRVNMTVGGQTVVAQRATVVDVALPTGQLPVDPIYRGVLLTWMEDWH